MKITLTELRRLVKNVIKEEIAKTKITENEVEIEDPEAAVKAMKKILSPSEIEFLKSEYKKLGEEGLADEIEDVRQLSEMEDSDTYGELSEKEYKLRNILNKIIKVGGVLSMLGIVPAAMFVSGTAGLGLGIASIVGLLFKDAAFWNKKGGIRRDGFEKSNKELDNNEF